MPPLKKMTAHIEPSMQCCNNQSQNSQSQPCKTLLKLTASISLLHILIFIVCCVTVMGMNKISALLIGCNNTSPSQKNSDIAA